MERVVLGSVLLFAELLVAIAAIPLIRRRVARNRWYGLRTTATLADDRTWYEANALAGWGLLGLGLLNGALTIAWLARVPGSSLPVVLLVLCATPLLALVLCSIAARRLRRRQRERAMR
jgi:SdpI/YfhL protein family